MTVLIMELKYVIAGAGATGESIGAFLTADGRDVAAACGVEMPVYHRVTEKLKAGGLK